MVQQLKENTINPLDLLKKWLWISTKELMALQNEKEADIGLH